MPRAKRCRGTKYRRIRVRHNSRFRKPLLTIWELRSYFGKVILTQESRRAPSRGRALAQSEAHRQDEAQRPTIHVVDPFLNPK